MDANYIAQMEKILWLYRLPYDEKFPVVCFDERPCFLIGNSIDPIAMQTGKVLKEHYAYEKNAGPPMRLMLPISFNRATNRQ
jgi:hypothetical protein